MSINGSRDAAAGSASPNPPVVPVGGASVTADWFDVDLLVVRRIQDAVNDRISEQEKASGATALSAEAQKVLAQKLISDEVERHVIDLGTKGQQVPTESAQKALRDAVFAAMFGLGHRLEALLNETDIEDVYINGSQAVIVKMADGTREVRSPIAESNEDLLTQLYQIAAHHGGNARPLSSARPFLNLRLPGHARLAAVWGLTPNPIVTIRRHRFVDVTLESLVLMGMLSRSMAAFLNAAVLAGRSILVVGGQGAGKTTLLRGLCRCISKTTRFATLETEYELLLHEMPQYFPNVVPYEARPGGGELDSSGHQLGEISLADIFPESLRHTIELYVFGETRGREVFPMMQAMSRGSKGALATLHADSAVAAFDSLATLMAEYKDNWTMDAAMQQIAGSVDIIVFVDSEEVADGSTVRFVKEIIEVGPVADSGKPAVNWIFRTQMDEDKQENSLDPRGYPVGKPMERAWPRKGHLDLQWLKKEMGGWEQVFPPRLGADGFGFDDE